jgi:hypothetical protein
MDLISDNKSLWHELVDWTSNGDKIRRSFLEKNNSVDIDKIEKYFTNLRLNDYQVKISIEMYTFEFIYSFIKY